jgi:hypothetical protein
MRRGLVVRLGADAVHEAELAGGNGLLGPSVPAVEAALEADVHGGARLGDDLGELHRLLESRGDRLLAEGRHSGVEAQAQQRGVARGGGRDDEAVDAVRQHRGRRRGKAHLEPLGQRTGGVGVEVADDELVDVTEAVEGLRVERPDASDSGQSDAHAHTPFG